jgi:hypothetical protein
VLFERLVEQGLNRFAIGRVHFDERRLAARLLDGVGPRLTALGAAAVALGLVPLTAPGVPVLAASLVAVALALTVRDVASDPAGDEPVGELP